MYLELLARIVRSSSICQVVFHLLYPILFCQCGHLSFCPLRVVSRPLHMRSNVDPVFWAGLAIRPDPLQRSYALGLFRQLLAVVVEDAEGLDGGEVGGYKTRGNGQRGMLSNDIKERDGGERKTMTRTFLHLGHLSHAECA